MKILRALLALVAILAAVVGNFFRRPLFVVFAPRFARIDVPLYRMTRRQFSRIKRYGSKPRGAGVAAFMTDAQAIQRATARKYGLTPGVSFAMASGPATPTPQQQQAAQLAAFLRWAKDAPLTMNGNIPSGDTGGKGTSVVTWSGTGDIPAVPKWCKAIDLFVTLPITLTLAATTGAATVSPFAPWSAISTSWDISGTFQWELIELTAHYLDTITRARNIDPGYPGLSEAYGAATHLWLGDDRGYYTLNGLTPGQTLTNTGSTATNTNYTLKFFLRIQLQEYRKQGFGLVPFGDPQNRPKLKVVLNNLIGVAPEASLFVNAVGGATACVTNGQPQVTALYRMLDVPLLPPGAKTTPYPTVGMVRQIVADYTQIANAGQIVNRKFDTKQQYDKIFGLLMNNEAPLNADYWGLWATGQKQSAIWEYDAADSSILGYAEDLKQRYNRYLPTGVHVADLWGGDLPELPHESPQVLQMTPDASLATAIGLPLTPNACVGIRVPQGTTIATAYMRNYHFGLVPASF